MIAEVLQLETSHRAVKRIRLETQKAASSSPVRAAVAAWETKPTVSPVKRTPQRVTPALVRDVRNTLIRIYAHDVADKRGGGTAGGDASSHREAEWGE